MSVTSILIGVIGIACTAKVRDFGAFRNSLHSFGFPQPTHTFIGILTVGAEIAALALLVSSSLRWAGTFCLIIFLTFTSVSSLALLQGRRPQCQCFGNLTSGDIGSTTILRNAILASCALVLLPEHRSFFHLIRSLNSSALVTVALSVCVVALVTLLIDILRRYGEALHTLDALGVDSVTHTPRRGLQPGESLPELALLDWDSHPVTLRHEVSISPRKPLVLLSSTCGHCDELIPSLRTLPATLDPGIVIVSGSTGGEHDRRFQGLRERGWSVLFTQSHDLATTFHIAGFPTLVPLDEDGSVEGGVVLGRQGIEGFLRHGSESVPPDRKKEPYHDRSFGKALEPVAQSAKPI